MTSTEITKHKNNSLECSKREMRLGWHIREQDDQGEEHQKVLQAQVNSVQQTHSSERIADLVSLPNRILNFYRLVNATFQYLNFQTSNLNLEFDTANFKLKKFVIFYSSLDYK